MFRIAFVRHTEHDLIGKAIAGRRSGLHLNETGRAKAEQLASELANLKVDVIYTSPLERTRETAEPISRRLAVPLEVAEELNEIDTGEWTGRTFAELAADPRWQAWNAFRSSVRPAGGESMIDVQKRVLSKIEAVRSSREAAIFVSHGDVIRAALCHYLGLHLDLLLRFEIDPGSVSMVDLYPSSSLVRLVNGRGADLINSSACG